MYCSIVILITTWTGFEEPLISHERVEIKSEMALWPAFVMAFPFVLCWILAELSRLPTVAEGKKYNVTPTSVSLFLTRPSASARSRLAEPPTLTSASSLMTPQNMRCIQTQCYTS